MKMRVSASTTMYRGYAITLKRYNDRWHVRMESPSWVFDSCSIFQERSDALEYAKLMINKWHAERSILTNGTNAQQ